MKIKYDSGRRELKATSFISLANRVWPGSYDVDRVEVALKKTIKITAWHNEILVGCVRILTDGYFFSTITEILIDPEYQRKGIGTQLMELAWEHSPSSLSFGVQPGNEVFFEKLGFEKGLTTYQKKKKRNP